MVNDINLQKNSRNDGIDLIRGLSVISVILLHLYIRVPFDKSTIGQLLQQRAINILFHSGYYGVIVFFVISGFLITTSSITRWGKLTDIKIFQFYRFRFARIFPCLVAFILLSSILHLLSIKGFVITTTSLDQAIFAALTFQINWLEAKTGYLAGAWDVLWSLSVEEMFYIFFPLLCCLVRNEFNFKLLMIIFIILGPFARCMFSDNEIWSDHSYLSCMDGIAIGCLAALYVSKLKDYSSSFLFSLIPGLFLFGFVFLFGKVAYKLGLTSIGINVTILEIGMALILIALQQFFVEKQHHGGWLFAPIRWFGKNSYEIYLTHVFIVLVIVQVFNDMKFSNQSIPFFYIIALVISGISGHLVAKYFSEPLNRMLRKRSVKMADLQYSKE